MRFGAILLAGLALLAAGAAGAQDWVFEGDFEHLGNPSICADLDVRIDPLPSDFRWEEVAYGELDFWVHGNGYPGSEVPILVMATCGELVVGKTWTEIWGYCYSDTTCISHSFDLPATFTLYSPTSHHDFDVGVWCSDGGGGRCGHPDCLESGGWNYTLELFRRSTWHVSVYGDDTNGGGSVDAPFATIAHAIELAAPGDTVAIADGTYLEHGLVLEAGLTILGNFADPTAVVVDAQQAGRVFSATGVDNTAALIGLTLTGGRADLGGAIRVASGSFPTIRNCRLTGNTATMGGAIHCSDGAAPRFEHTLIAGNQADLGGGAYMDNASPQFLNCTIADNQSPPACLFASASTLTLENTIIAFNGPGPSVRSFTSTASLDCCDVYGNDGGDYVYAFEGAMGQDGNISVAPLFCSGTLFDYSLNAGSVCLPASDYNPCGEQIGAYGEGAGCDLVDAEPIPGTDGMLRLQPNYPNPFNPTTEIAFVLPEATTVELAIFDLAGCRVRSLAGGPLAAGPHSVTWDGRDDTGQALPSGVYFCQLLAGAHAETRKLTMLK
jgi:hypothetical protein